MNKIIGYREMLLTLRMMDEKLLIELFHDIDDIDVIVRIADCAYHFVENYEAPEGCKIMSANEMKEIDDAQRRRDMNGID